MNRVANGATDTLPAVVERPAVELIPTKYSFDEMQKIAESSAKSGLFNPPGGIMSRDQAFTLMLIADADGIPPIKALMKYHVIEGKPSLKADAALADFQRVGGRHKWIKSNETECIAEFWHQTMHPDPFRIHLTFQYFVDKGIALGKYDERSKQRLIKKNWNESPAQMLRARCITQGVRAVYPGIMVGIYCEEELDREEQDAPDPIRATLLEKLNAQKAKPAIETTATVVESKPADPPFDTKKTEEPKAKPEPPKSEPRKFIDSQVEFFNAEVRKMNPEAKTVNANQVVNGIVSEWLKAGDIEESMVLNGAGKRDGAKIGETLKTMWAGDQTAVTAAVSNYLAIKFDEAKPAETTQKQGSLLSDDEASLSEES